MSGEDEGDPVRHVPDGTRAGLLNGHGFHFFEGGMTLEAFLDAVLHEGRHPVLNGSFDHLFCFRFRLNQPLQFVRSEQ